MSRALSSTAKRAIFAQRTDQVFVILLTISHSSFDDDIRLCSDPTELLPLANVRGILSRGLEFVYMPFNITFPQQDDTNISRATLSIDNVDREIVSAVRAADSEVYVKIEVVLASTPDSLEVSIEDFKLMSVDYTSAAVSGELSMEYYDLEPFPSMRFTPSVFPGAF